MSDKPKRTKAEKEARVRKLRDELEEAMHELVQENGGTFADQEQAIADMTRELQKEMTKRGLQRISDGFGERVLVGNKIYQRYWSGMVRYSGLAGELRVQRNSYREEGVRNGPTVVPLELVAGLRQRATPALARNLVHGYARHDMRTHGELLREAHCSPPPRATMERMVKALAVEVSEQVAAVETLAFSEETVPSEAKGLSIGFDRVSIPMAEALADGETKAPPVRREPYKRAVPAPMVVNWRMAFVGTVSLLDKHGDAIRVTRYAANAADDPTLLTARMQRQVTQLLDQSPKLRVGIVQDGAPEMWNLMRDILKPLKKRKLIKRSWYETIDLPHLMGRLGEAFRVALGGTSAVVNSWKAQLLESNDTIDTIEATLRRQLPALAGEDAETLQGHLTYIENNKDRMRYAKVRKAGLPIGSGVTESTAKNVVNMRTKRSGQRWSIPGLRGVLTLRALLKSDRLGSFWDVFSARYLSQVHSLPVAA